MVGRILRHVTQLHFDTLAIATFRPAHDSAWVSFDRKHMSPRGFFFCWTDRALIM